MTQTATTFRGVDTDPADLRTAFGYAQADSARGQRTNAGWTAGDFASGMRTMTASSILGDFASGMRTMTASATVGDFATGMRTMPSSTVRGSFATGMVGPLGRGLVDDRLADVNDSLLLAA